MIARVCRTHSAVQQIINNEFRIIDSDVLVSAGDVLRDIPEHRQAQTPRTPSEE